MQSSHYNLCSLQSHYKYFIFQLKRIFFHQKVRLIEDKQNMKNPYNGKAQKNFFYDTPFVF